MKAILTVIGTDKPGIIAGISGNLLESNVNIIDVNQTIMENYFTMIMMLDLGTSNLEFDEIKKSILKKGEELGVEAKIQRQEIFDAMHTL